MFRTLFICLALVLAAGAAHAQSMPAMLSTEPDPAPRHPELKPYLADFGGKAGLVALVDDFMAHLMADPRMRPFFATIDRGRVKRELVDQFCVILDGPCTYTGKPMEFAHEDFDIRRADFNALVEDLQKTMAARHVPFRAQNKLLAVLAPMHREIVNKP